NLEDARLFTESRDAYVDAAVRTGRRGGDYRYDFFISSTSKTDAEAKKLAALLAAKGLTSYATAVDFAAGSGPREREALRPTVDTCRHLILLARDSVSSWHRDELNYFLRQSLDEQSERLAFALIGAPRVLRDLPPLIQSLPAFSLTESRLPDAAATIAARVRSDTPHVGFSAPSTARRGRAFVSHVGADRAWAEWVAWHLRDAGYDVTMNVLPRTAGASFLTTVTGLPPEDRIVALYSAAYFGEGEMSADELAVLLSVPEKFVPLRVADADMPPPLRGHGVTDLFTVTEPEAREALLRAVAEPGATAGTPPVFPAGGTAGTAEGGSGARHVPARNADFVGRIELLMDITTKLRDASVVALTGPCGAGKTQAAIEYAHQSSHEYDLIRFLRGSWDAELAELAVDLGCAESSTPYSLRMTALRQELARRSRWLLIIDDVEDPGSLADLLPIGSGHVLITSRNPHWRPHAATLDVDGLFREDSVALLTSRSRDLTDADAIRLAEALDDLPLALAQAAEALYVFPPDQYLQMLAEHAAEALRDDGPPDYPGSLATQLAESMSRLTESSPEAAAVVRAYVLMARAPLPLTPSALAVSPHAFRELFMRVERVGLARVAGGGIQMSGLAQAVLRDQLTPQERAKAASDASHLLTANATDAPRRAALLPHLLAIAPNDLVTNAARTAALRACRDLVVREDFVRAGRRLQSLYASWQQELGEDSVFTLTAAAYFASAQAGRGRHTDAYRWGRLAHHGMQDKITADHPDSLRVADNLAVDLAALGRVQEAVDLGEETLARRRRILGEDDLDTLHTASNLAIDLAALGRTGEADALREDTLARQRRLFGQNHPDIKYTVERRKWRGLPALPES
ncbi:MAG: toll/interleukin-1 receptor domain-containing protein, partial [Nonomuraea sp.]|nr:toll/interleukin-1 receptor domain-containing protein [Nonomuraea sp.]